MIFVFALLLAFCACWIQWTPPMRFALNRPDYSADARIEPEGGRLAVALNVSSPIGASEYYRRLSVTNIKGAKSSFDLAPDHGGFAPVSLYRREDGRIVVASSLDGTLLLDFEAPSVIRYDSKPTRSGGGQECGSFQPKESGRIRDGLAESKYIPGLFYLGRFDFEARGAWGFISAFERPERLRETGVGDFWDPGCP